MQPFDELSSRGQSKARANGLASGPSAGENGSAELNHNGHGDARNCASLLLETMPRVWRAIRVGLGGGGSREEAPVTVAQYRTLFYLHRHEGASLSELAEFLGLTLPSASKLVDHLVKRTIVLRQADHVDRRRMTLRMSRRGDALFNNAQERVRLHLAGMLGQCDSNELQDLGRALGFLQESFPPLGGDFEKPRGETGGEGAASGKSVTRSASTS